MSLISPPPNQAAVTNNKGIVEPAWKANFTDIYNLLQSLTGSGITANRPAKFLWIGRPYFDTTLGKPIWYNGSIWVKHDGTAA